jgi:GH24 family phage-related lysozyme (muramidase)
MAVVEVQGIGDALSPEQRNGLSLLTSLPLEQFNQLKQIMELDGPGVLGPPTLSHFLDLCRKLSLDLSAGGVAAFQAAHGLGHAGVLQGVIGPQTAGAYFEAIMTALAPGPARGNLRPINAAGLALIQAFEGLERKIPGVPDRVAAYLDPVGVPTIGYGHTRGVALGQVITFQRAEEFLREDLAGSEAAVSALVKVALTENQFAALVSFTFNLGAPTLKRSTLLRRLKRSTLLRRLNQGDYSGAADQFSRFTLAHGRRLPGLVRRRAAERALFLA